MDTNKIFESKTFRSVILIIGVVIVALLIFSCGMFVGFKKANFSNRFAENYRRDFGDPRGGMMREFSGRDLPTPHGVAGTIVKIELADDSATAPLQPSANSSMPQSKTTPPAPKLAATLVVQGQDNIEKTVLVTDFTRISKNRDTLKPADLKAGDKITIIGRPSDLGQIEARLIRIFQ